MRQRSAGLLFEFLCARHDLVDLSATLTVPQPFLLPDPYLLASAFQKAIRRGEYEIARRAAHQLHELDRHRVWRRLAVTALEDIGIGDIAAAAELVAIACLPTSRRLFGDDLAALDFALSIACRAIKDRSGDHLYSVATREPVTAQDQALLDSASANALRAVVASSDQLWDRRLRAVVRLSCGVQEVGYQADNVVALLQMYQELGVSDLLIAACNVYAVRQRDLLPVFVPLAWLVRSPSCTPEVVEHRLNDGELVGDMPAYALDPVNTRLGRRAVDLFLRAHTVRPPYSPRLVAAAIWNAESALCDRTLAWELGDEIRKRGHRADLTYRGLPVENHATLNDWIAAQRPALIAARQAVWNAAVKELGKSVEAPEQANLPLPVPESRSRRG